MPLGVVRWGADGQSLNSFHNTLFRGRVKELNLCPVQYSPRTMCSSKYISLTVFWQHFSLLNYPPNCCQKQRSAINRRVVQSPEARVLCSLPFCSAMFPLILHACAKPGFLFYYKWNIYKPFWDKYVLQKLKHFNAHIHQTNFYGMAMFDRQKSWGFC